MIEPGPPTLSQVVGLIVEVIRFDEAVEVGLRAAARLPGPGPTPAALFCPPAAEDDCRGRPSGWPVVRRCSSCRRAYCCLRPTVARMSTRAAYAAIQVADVGHAPRIRSGQAHLRRGTKFGIGITRSPTGYDCVVHLQSRICSLVTFSTSSLIT